MNRLLRVVAAMLHLALASGTLGSATLPEAVDENAHGAGEAPSETHEVGLNPDLLSPPPFPAAARDFDEEALVRAHTAYDEGDYDTALAPYEAVPETRRNGHYYYNVGSVLLRSGELGRAIASYRQSAAELPRDPDVAANLDFARKSAKDALAPPEPPALLRTLFFWHFSLGRSEQVGLFLIVNLLLWTALAVRWLRPRWYSVGGMLVLLAVIWSALAGSLFWRAAYPTRLAVVLPPEVEVLSAPNVDATVRFKLHAGAELMVREERPGWVEVMLPDDQRGWLQAEDLQRLEL